MMAPNNRIRRFFPRFSASSEYRERRDSHMTPLLARTSLEIPPPPRPAYNNTRRRSYTHAAVFPPSVTAEHYTYFQRSNRMDRQHDRHHDLQRPEERDEPAVNKEDLEKVRPVKKKLSTFFRRDKQGKPVIDQTQDTPPPPATPALPATPRTDKPLPRLPIEDEDRFKAWRPAPPTPDRPRRPSVAMAARGDEGGYDAGRVASSYPQPYVAPKEQKKRVNFAPFYEDSERAHAAAAREDFRKTAFGLENAMPLKPKPASQSSNRLQLPTGLFGSRSTNNLTRPMQTDNGFDPPDSGVTAMPRATSVANLHMPRNLMSGVKNILTGKKDKRKTMTVPTISAPVALQSSPKAQHFFTGAQYERSPIPKVDADLDSESDEEEDSDGFATPYGHLKPAKSTNDLPSTMFSKPNRMSTLKELSPEHKALDLARAGGVNINLANRKPVTGDPKPTTPPSSDTDSVFPPYVPPGLPDITPGPAPTIKPAGAAAPLDNPKYVRGITRGMHGLHMLPNVMEFAGPPQWYLDGLKEDPNPPPPPPASGVTVPNDTEHSDNDFEVMSNYSSLSDNPPMQSTPRSAYDLTRRRGYMRSNSPLRVAHRTPSLSSLYDDAQNSATRFHGSAYAKNSSESDYDGNSYKSAPSMHARYELTADSARLSTVLEEAKRNSDSTKRSSDGLPVDVPAEKKRKSDVDVMAQTVEEGTGAYPQSFHFYDDKGALVEADQESLE